MHRHQISHLIMSIGMVLTLWVGLWWPEHATNVALSNLIINLAWLWEA